MVLSDFYSKDLYFARVHISSTNNYVKYDRCTFLKPQDHAESPKLIVPSVHPLALHTGKPDRCLEILD